jgi:hypothetical protein
MEPFRSTFDGGIDATFARIAAGSRMVAAVWMAILGAVTLTRDDGIAAGWVVGTIAIGFLWAVAATVIAYPQRALSREMLVVDLAVGVLSLLAPGFAGTTASFYGGLPLIVVAIAALRGRIEGLITAAILIVTVLGTILSDISYEEIIGETTLIFAYLGVGVLVAWIGDVLRQAGRGSARRRQRCCCRSTCSRRPGIRTCRHRSTPARLGASDPGAHPA